MLWSTIVLAFKAIARNRMRSLLTALGVVIGVASVIGMVHLGQAATQSVTGQISSLGSGLLYVLPGTSRRGPAAVSGAAESFASADVDALKRDILGVHVAPVTSQRALLVYGNANYATTVTGTDNGFFLTRDWELSQGRSFEARELSRGAAVCVVGQTVVDELFAGEDPIGDSMRVGKASCSIIGVLTSKGKSFGNDQDEIVLMPLRAVQRRLAGTTDIHLIYVSVSSAAQTSTRAVKLAIEELLRERRRIRDGEEDDFHVRDMEDIANTLSSTTSILTALLGAVAAVSLLVGGIGIMNIMMVSVTERTREIGIRLAIGARGREVLLQFLVEAVAVSVLGGALGVVVGVVGSWYAVRQLKMEFVVSPDIIGLAFAFSVIIGVVFGFVPARKAARLDPIEALRHE
ncbi:MAG: FtsX-like permease family protein [Myxococcales bacterium FL481]|nr:MAG: FtsX-like permease family protein [Myxococcales bacterium FL481]